METRAAIIEHAGGPLRIETVELAAPAAGEVRVRMAACGICRSDLHAIDGGEDVRFPAVLGHEGAGVVDAVGPGVTHVTPDDFVVLSWTPACGACPPCRRGEVHLCQGVRMSAGTDGPLRWGERGLDRFMRLGAFSEHVIVPERMAVPVPPRLPATEACLIGCGVMTGFGAATHTAAVRAGECVVVFGCGSVGLAAIQGARIAGAGQIIAVDPMADRRALAQRLGATAVLDPDGAGAHILGLTEDGVDVALECVGKPDVMVTAYSVLRPGGRAVVVGLPDLSATVEFAAVALLTERSIGGSMYGSATPARDFPHLVHLCAQGTLDLASLVGCVRPFTTTDVNAGIADMRAGTYARVVLTFGDAPPPPGGPAPGSA